MIRFTIEGVKHEYDDERLSNVEALAVGRVTTEHLTPIDYLKAVTQFDTEAITCMVWLTLRREGQADLKFSEVEFDVVELITSFEGDEVEEEEEPDPTLPAVRAKRGATSK